MESYPRRPHAFHLANEHHIAHRHGQGDSRQGRIGGYASESEVIRDGLRALMARDRAMESWLREQVAPAFDRLKADPSRARSIKQVRARLVKQHKRARSKR